MKRIQGRNEFTCWSNPIPTNISLIHLKHWLTYTPNFNKENKKHRHYHQEASQHCQEPISKVTDDSNVLCLRRSALCLWFFVQKYRERHNALLLPLISKSSQGYGFSSGHVWMRELDCEISWVLKNWCFWTVVLEKTLESPLDCKDIQPVHPKGVLGVHWKDWCWIWNSNTLATSCEELTHWKRLWCWEGLGAGGEGDNRGWDGWMASPTQWTWVWVNSGCWWWTGRPGVLWFMGSQRDGHNSVTELNWVRRSLGLTSSKIPLLAFQNKKYIFKC